MEQSEFGRGCVVCLAKFSEHFENDMMKQIMDVHFWKTTLDMDDERLKSYDKNVQENVAMFRSVFMTTERDYDAAMSSMVTLWASGSTDHLYDLTAPETASVELKGLINQLQEKGLDMGHGAGLMRTRNFGFDDVLELHKLTREIELKIDTEMLGIKDADVGKW